MLQVSIAINVRFSVDRKVSQIHEITSSGIRLDDFRQTEQPGAYSQTSLFTASTFTSKRILLSSEQN